MQKGKYSIYAPINRLIRQAPFLIPGWYSCGCKELEGKVNRQNA